MKKTVAFSRDELAMVLGYEACKRIGVKPGSVKVLNAELVHSSDALNHVNVTVEWDEDGR